MHQISSWLPFRAAVLGIVLWMQAAARGEPQPQPAIIIGVAGVQRLLDDVETLSRLADRPQLPAMVRGLLEQGGGLAGVDRLRPWGLLIYLDESQPARPEVALAVPVSDVAALRQTLQTRFAATLEPTEGDRWSISGRGRVFAGRLREGMMVFGSESVLDQLADAPLGALKDLADRYDAAIRIQRVGFPPDQLAAVLREFEQGLTRELEKPADEDVVAEEIRRELLELIGGFGRDVFHETESLDLGVQVQKEFSVHAVWGARPTGRLAELLRSLHLDSAEFPPRGADEALSLRFALSLPVDVREVVGKLIGVVRGRLEQDVPADERRPVEGMLTAVAGSIQEGRCVATARFVPASGQRMAFLAEMHVAHVELLAESLARILPHARQSPRLANVELDVIREPEFRLHRLTPTEFEPRERRLYGPDAAIYVGTDDRRLRFAVGGPDVPTLLRQQAAAAPESHPPLLELTLHMHPWLLFGEQSERPTQELRQMRQMRQAMPTGTDDTLHLTVRATEQGLHARVDLEAGYVRFLSQQLMRDRTSR